MGIKKIIKEAIREELEELLPKLINKALMREITLQDGHSEPGVVKNVVKKINVIDQLVFYLPYIEKSIVGVQADVCETKNKINFVKNRTNEFIELFNHIVMTGSNMSSNALNNSKVEYNLLEKK